MGDMPYPLILPRITACAGRGLLLMLFCVLGAAAVAAAEIEGPVSVVDGDSLRIGATELRLHGIDAPELQQSCRLRGELWACGRAAAETLAFLVQRKPVHCRWDDTDTYGRGLARCTRNGQDLNALMVESGMALAYRRYSERYVVQEERARAARRGLWEGEFEAPWEWRQRSPRGPAPAAARDCPVKGNVNASGARIYHTPDSPAYDRVRIKPAEGDRCFDNVAAARAAGFRAPRR